MVAPNSEYLEFDLRLQARDAITQLEQLTAKATTFGERIKLVQAELQKFSQSTGMSMKATKSFFQDIDKTLSDTGKGSVLFGQMAKQGWQEVGEGAEKASNKVSSSVNVMRIAMGILVSQLIHGVLQAFQSMVTGAISGLRELEVATYNLVNAERALSEKGVDITPQGLDETIKKLQTLDPLLSRQQATEVVSRVATNVAPNVGFDAKQIGELSNAIAVLAIRNKALGYSFEEVEKAITDGLLSGKVSQGINKFGVKITDQIVRDEALRKGLVKTAEEFDKLTGKQEQYVKSQAILSILVKNTNEEQKHLPEYLGTVDAKFGILQARWADFLAAVGEKAAPILGDVFEKLIGWLEQILEWMNKNSDALNVWAQVAAALADVFLDLIAFVIKFGTAFGFIMNKSLESLQKLIDKFPLLKKVIDALTKAYGAKTDIGSATDTPTGTGAGNGETPQQSQYQNAVKEGEKKLQEILKDSADKKLDIEKNYQEKKADIALDYVRKLEDIARNTAQKTADAQSDYADKVADINSDAEKKKIDAKTESHKKEVEAEKKYQDELKKLKEKYLLDLEDALRARDARQVLRLMRQYQIDKQHALENRNEEKAQAQSDAAEKLQEIEKDRKEKLAQARKDLEDKLRDIKLSAARERQEAAIARNRALQDAKKAYERQLADHREFLKRKIRDLVDALAQEYNLSAAGVQALQNLFASAAGSGSTTSGGTTAGGTSGGISSTSPNSTSWTTQPFGTYTQPFGTHTSGLAEGGSFLATKPTTLNIAENRPELITATPLGRPGTDINKLFTNASLGGRGGNGGNGKLDLGIMLSPDLEARIVNKSMDATANVITRITKSR